MSKAVIFSAGRIRVCVDCEQVVKIYSDHNNTAEVLVDWQVYKKSGGENVARAQLLFLAELLRGKAGPEPERKRLAIIAEGEESLGLVVESLDREIEVASEEIQDLPMAFSSFCRNCFPRVVLYENEVIPMVSYTSLLAMSAHAAKAEKVEAAEANRVQV